LKAARALLAASLAVNSVMAGAVAGDAAQMPWLDIGLGVNERARQVVHAMTLEEKLSLLHGDTLLDANGTGTNACVGHLPAIERLGLPALCFGDGPAGVGNGSTQVTQFPAPIAGAATWDVALLGEYGRALAEEHAGKGRNVVLAPTLNILRTPKWGRAAESLGEDPYLTGRIGAAVINGIQSRHVIATPKHFVANNQETLRLGDAPNYAAIDVRVSERALREIYYPAFRTAVTEAHAGSIMCSYNQVNGIYACENPALESVLRREWKFDGFVVSDWYFAHRSTVASALAGLDVSMPGGASDFGFPEFYGAPLRRAIDAGSVPTKRVDTLVENVVRPMFRLGLIDSPVPGNAAADVRSVEHRELALKIATQGSVLLKNPAILPLTAATHRLAVIGDDAGPHVQSSEQYGGFVNDPHFTVRAPLEAITERAAGAIKIEYAAGTLGTGPLPNVPASALSPMNHTGVGLSATWFGSADFSAPVLHTTDPTVDLRRPPAGLPAVWSVRWQGYLTPPRTGRYRFSLSGGGDSALYVNGHPVVRTLKQGFTSVTHGVVNLTAHRPVSVRIDYSMASTISVPTLQWGWQIPDDLFAEAVAAAKRADTVIVFASDRVSEGGDRTNLELPGDQDQLIEAIAAANPRTIVVLHTVGPVLMPWLAKVAAVIESWYPGEEAAAAIAGMLFGDSNPSGKLPMTFPAGETQGLDSKPNLFPGVQGRVDYEEDLLVGYRYYDSKQRAPLFPFGFGLSYTTFEIGGLKIERAAGSLAVEGIVRNSGQRPGAEVVQLYLGYPQGAGEPPWQLKGFERITLAPGEKHSFRFVVSQSDLAVWDSAQHQWRIPKGRYQIGVGRSSRDIDRHVFIEL
jgi:beta-glucosidase